MPAIAAPAAGAPGDLRLVRREVEVAGDGELDRILERLDQIGLADETQLAATRQFVLAERPKWQGTRIEAAVTAQLGRLDRAMVEKSRGRTQQALQRVADALATDPRLDRLHDLFATVHDPQLMSGAEDAGGTCKQAFDASSSEVTARYLAGLRAAADAARQATTGTAMAPFGMLEDALDVLAAHELADDPGTDRLRTMRREVRAEVDRLAIRVFDRDYQARQPAQDLLADGSWIPIESPSFRFRFDSGLELENRDGEGAASGGLCFGPGNGWRDYVLDFQVRVDSGQLVVYLRVGDRLDSRFVPSLSIDPSKPEGGFGYGTVHAVCMSVIGNQRTILVDGSEVERQTIPEAMSRKGGPGIHARVGTKAFLSRLQVRLLR